MQNHRLQFAKQKKKQPKKPLLCFNENKNLISCIVNILLSSPIKFSGYDVTGSSPCFFLQNIPQGNFSSVKYKNFNITYTSIEKLNASEHWNMEALFPFKNLK